MCEDSITREELVAALSEVWMVAKWPPTADGCKCARPESFADDLLDYAKQIREPVYEHGEFYADDTGAVFYRRKKDWIQATGGVYYAHSIPKRPMRKLVPEGDIR